MVEQPALTCAKCGAAFVREPGPGRPAVYCGETCRRLVEFEIRRVDRRLARYELEQRELKARGVSDLDFEEQERQRRLRALRTWIRTDERRLRELLGGAADGQGNQEQST